MPDLFVQGLFANNTPFWHGKGIVLPDHVVTMERVIELVPILGMTVREVEVWANLGGGSGFKVPDMKARFRMEDGHYLGTVGKDNGLIQNVEGMDFLDDVLGPNEAHVDTAGVLNDGKECWVQCLTDAPFMIAGVKEETTSGFLTFLNSFDGSRPVMVITGEQRVGCHNTFLGAIGSARDRYIFKHTGLIRERLEMAKTTIKTATSHWAAYKRLGEVAIKAPFGDKQFMGTLDELIPLPSLRRLDYDPDLHKRIEQNAEEERDTVKAIWLNSPSNAHCRKTAWAAINTWTEYLDHHTKSRQTQKSDQAENRMKRILFDTSLREKAVAMITQSAELVGVN